MNLGFWGLAAAKGFCSRAERPRPSDLIELAAKRACGAQRACVVQAQVAEVKAHAGIQQAERP
jgi:hypothetical protein